MHLRRVEHGGLSFSGFAGAPGYDFSDAEASALIGRLPAADVLVTHTPPAGVNDDPDDPVHRGWTGLGAWVARERPAWLLHGHTTPLPGRRVARLGTTRIAYVRGAAILEL